MQKDTRTDAEKRYDSTRLSPLSDAERYAALDEAEALVGQVYGPGPSPAELVELAGRVDAVLAADRAPAGSATWVQHDGYIEYEVNSAAISIGEGRIVAVHCFGTSHDLDAGGRAALRDLALVLADPRVQVWLHQGAATERYEPWKDIFDWADGRK